MQETLGLDDTAMNRIQNTVPIDSEMQVWCSTGDPRVPSANTLPEPADTVPFMGTGLHYPLLDMGITTTRVPTRVSGTRHGIRARDRTNVVGVSRDTPIRVHGVTNAITRARWPS